MITTVNLMLSRLAVARIRAQRGMSMMELMVGLAIGMVLTLGMFTMIVSTSQSFRVNDDFSRMQENAVSAFRYLGDSLRQAGFYGSSQDTTSMTIAAGSAVATTTDCGSAAITPSTNFALDFRTPIRAYMNYTPLTVNADFPCILQGNFNQGPLKFMLTNFQKMALFQGASLLKIPFLLASLPKIRIRLLPTPPFLVASHQL